MYISLNASLFRTKYAGQTAKAPVIDCSRAGYYKVNNKNNSNIANNW